MKKLLFLIASFLIATTVAQAVVPPIDVTYNDGI